MRYAIIGNNDGPLRLIESLSGTDMPSPVCVGLQNPPDPVLNRKMEQLQIPYFSGFSESGLLKYLQNFSVDILINCFCNFRFDVLLDKYECYNIHPSALPSYKGRHPMHWALINGEEESGISIHAMTGKIDEGAVYWQSVVEIYESDSVGQLRERLMTKLESGFPLFLNRLRSNELQEVDTSHRIPSYFPPRSPSDSRLLRWSDPSRIFRKIMALRSTAFPAYLQFSNGHKFIVPFAKWHRKNKAERGKLAVKAVEAERILISFTNGQEIWFEQLANTDHDYSLIQWTQDGDPPY